MADGFKSLAAHILMVAVPNAIERGSDDRMVNALIAVVQEAVETWFAPAPEATGLALATKEFIKQARKCGEENEESI